MKVDGQFLKALKMSINNKKKAGWSREIGSGFIAEELQLIERDDFSGEITIYTEGYTQTIPIIEFNLRETEELLKWLEYQDGDPNTPPRMIPYEEG